MKLIAYWFEYENDDVRLVMELEDGQHVRLLNPYWSSISFPEIECSATEDAVIEMTKRYDM